MSIFSTSFNQYSKFIENKRRSRASKNRFIFFNLFCILLGCSFLIVLGQFRTFKWLLGDLKSKWVSTVPTWYYEKDQDALFSW
jgi:hypothetical protein